MQIPDVNVLLYAYDEGSRHGKVSQEWLERSLSGEEPVGFAWMAIIGFVRIATNPRIYEDPYPAAEALDIVASWLSQPQATIIEPGRRHMAVLRSLLDDLGTAGNLTTDAHLGALAIEHNATLVSFDNDFSRFSGLRWLDPNRIEP